MDVSAYSVEAEVEATHWWFAGRRRMLASLIASTGVSRDALVLDIGTSTGTNLRMLRELGFTRFEGLDSSAEAVSWCAEKGLGKVTRGDACSIPFPDSSFDLVLATDIIEHVDDDARAVSEISRVMKPGATVILTVPAFQSLWGLQDEVAQHKRRYRGTSVLNLLRRTQLRVLDSFYFNYLLFLPILSARRIIRLCRVKLKSENQLNSPLINAVLTKVFAFDVWSAPRLKPPFGVSYLAIAVKDGVHRNED